MKTITPSQTRNANPFSFSGEDVVLSPGEYLIVDPCYVAIDAEWPFFCDAFHSRDGHHSGYYRGHNFFISNTAYGDGSYSLRQSGKSIGWCGVDAGLLSIIPLALIKLWKSEENYRGSWPDMGGIWIKIKENTPVTPYGRGSFRFGSFDLNTDGDDEDEVA